MISQIFISPDTFDKKNDVTAINSMLNDIDIHPVFVVDFEFELSLVKYVAKNYLNQYEVKHKTVLMKKLEQLRKHKKFFKRPNPNGEIKEEGDWYVSAKAADKEKPFDMCITGNGQESAYRMECQERVGNINDIVISPEQWNAVKLTDTEVRKTPTDYERAFGEVLRHSMQVKIVDVYIGEKFRHDQKQFSKADGDIIERFSKLLAENKGGKGVFEIHTMLDKYLNLTYSLPWNELKVKVEEEYRKDDKYKRKRENWFKVMQKLANTYGHTYKVYFWSQRGPKSTFHDRYIFTNLIGISPNHSISASEDSEQDTLWKVLNRTEWEKQELKYDFDDPYFIPSCEPIEVSPNEQ